MTFSKKYGLRPADRIVEPITNAGPAKHHSIYLGKDNAGVEWLAENAKFDGVRLIKAQDYFHQGKTWTRIEPFVGTPTERKAAVQRALSLTGTPYNLINFNCEHFAEHVQRGRLRSFQIETALVITLTVLFIILILPEK